MYRRSASRKSSPICVEVSEYALHLDDVSGVIFLAEYNCFELFLSNKLSNGPWISVRENLQRKKLRKTELVSDIFDAIFSQYFLRRWFSSEGKLEVSIHISVFLPVFFHKASKGNIFYSNLFFGIPVEVNGGDIFALYLTSFLRLILPVAES